MADAALTIVSPPRQAGVAAPPDVLGWMPLMEAFGQLQRLQWDMFSAWQRTLLAMQKELFDEWACRWAGGAPIDA